MNHALHRPERCCLACRQEAIAGAAFPVVDVDTMTKWDGRDNLRRGMHGATDQQPAIPRASLGHVPNVHQPAWARMAGIVGAYHSVAKIRTGGR